MDVTSVITWRKASYSGNNGGACVEVGTSADDPVVHVRDTVDRERGMLTVPAAGWRRFIAAIKALPVTTDQNAEPPDQGRSGGFAIPGDGG